MEIYAIQKRQSDLLKQNYDWSTSFSAPQDSLDLNRQIRIMQRQLDKLQPDSPYIVINTQANELTWRTHDEILLKTKCSTGNGSVLVDDETGRKWIFTTPKGVFHIENKLVNPWWRKPDWAYIEENEEIPSDPRKRYDSEMLGDYALGFGNGYFIHGTLYERLLGINVTHGCVRLSSEDLDYLYKHAGIGTMVFIF